MKKGLWKRTAAGMLAAMMLAGNFGTVYAAESNEVRSKAKEALEASDFQTAKTKYDELIAMEAADGGDYWYAGKSEHGLGYYYTANERFDTAQELSSNNGPLKSVYEQKMRSMYSAGDYWYVERYYNEAVEAGIVTSYMKSVYGDSLANCRQYQKALEMYREILDAYEGGDVAYQAVYLDAIGDMYEKMRQFEMAAKTYEEIKALDGDEKEYHQRMAEMELEYKTEETEQIITSHMKEMSNEQIADTLAEYGHYEEALTYYEKAEAGEGADHRLAQAETYYNMGMPKEAAAIYEEILQKEPENTTAMNSLGAIYCDALGRYEEAEELFKKVIDLHPEANGTSGNLGVVARKSGDFSKTVTAYQNAAEKFPNYISAYNNSIIYRKDITVEEAKEALAQYPGWPESETMQAMLLIDTIGTYAMTTATMESYLSYFQDRLAEDGGNYYYLKATADLLSGMGHYTEALDYYFTANEAAGILSYYAVNALGNCYFYCGDYENAITCYEKNVTNDPELLFSIADCYMMMQDVENAKVSLERYQAEGGTESVASYKMMFAYQENDYEALLTYADQCLEEAPDSVKAKAYKAVALEALDMEGAEEMIADIDSIVYAVGDTKILIAESILGRLDHAKEVYRVMQQLYPQDAREALVDYEIRNLLSDPEFCKMAGLEVPEAENDTVTEEKQETSGVLPIAIGVGAAVVLGGTVAVLMRKRKNGNESSQ